MRLLLTNDDGIFSEGLVILAQKLSHIADVTIVAPDRERSATAHAITMHKPLRVEKVIIPQCCVNAWKVNGTPSDCVKLALEALLDFKPDIVLSGINRGSNLGTDVMYSGTVSAAIEAALSGIPAIAFSVTGYENINFDIPAELAMSLYQQIYIKKFPDNSLLNINIPPQNKENLNGVYITHLGIRKYKNSFDKRIDPRGRTYYWLGGEVIENTDDIGSDVWAINNNYISVTPIHFDLTKYDTIDYIKKWNLKI